MTHDDPALRDDDPDGPGPKFVRRESADAFIASGYAQSQLARVRREMSEFLDQCGWPKDDPRRPRELARVTAFCTAQMRDAVDGVLTHLAAESATKL